MALEGRFLDVCVSVCAYFLASAFVLPPRILLCGASDKRMTRNVCLTFGQAGCMPATAASCTQEEIYQATELELVCKAYFVKLRDRISSFISRVSIVPSRRMLSFSWSALVTPSLLLGLECCSVLSLA